MNTIGQIGQRVRITPNCQDPSIQHLIGCEGLITDSSHHGMLLGITITTANYEGIRAFLLDDEVESLHG